jgi:hypothetical protein
VPLELYTNRSYYFEKPIEQYEGQTREFLWMDMPARYEHVARSIRALSVINKFIPLRNTSNEAPERQSIGQRAVEELLGIKASSVDIKKVYKAKIWELQQDVAALKRGVKMADRYGRNEEINRIAEKLDVVEKRIETIKKFVGEK